MHRLTAAVNERIAPKVLEDGIPPTQSLWAGTFCFSQQHEQSSEGLAFWTGRQKPKIANCLSVTIWHMRSQQACKLGEPTSRRDQPPRFGVLRDELNVLIRDLQQAPVSNWGPAYIPRGVSQKV
jgi:hypothetical protein